MNTTDRLLRPMIIASTLTLALLTAEAAAVVHSVGIARSADGNDIRYIEHHQYLDDGTHLVRYFDPDSDLLVEKELSYPGLPQHPVMRQADYVTDTSISIETRQDEATIIRTDGEKTRSFSFQLDDNVVVDAGFDTYIRTNWETLRTEGKARVKLAVAGQARLLTMDIRYEGEGSEGSNFSVRPANWLISALIPDIQLTYDRDRQLARYEGFSNLKPPEGSGREVVITFDHYTLEQPLNRPLEQWLP